MKQSYTQHLARVKKQTNAHSHIDLLTVSHRAVIDESKQQASRVSAFLGDMLDHQKAAVESALYRSRA